MVLDKNGRPLSVAAGEESDREEVGNVISWMDHRAREEALEINRSGQQVLDYVGGTISPEMQTPK